MKQIIVLLGFALILKMGYSQEGVALKDGYQVFKYPNGAVSSEGMLKNGKPEGFWKSYYVTGIKNRKDEEQTSSLTVSGFFMIRQGIQLKKLTT